MKNHRNLDITAYCGQRTLSLPGMKQYPWVPEKPV